MHERHNGNHLHPNYPHGMLHLEGGGAGVRAGGGLGDTNPPPLVKYKKIDFILD
jgi:hypothetical protein